jgi:GTP-binding protein
MRFIDEAKIKITAGHGGRGCVSFRREKYVPRGGPNGGNGGDGGDVLFRASERMATLQDFRFKRTYEAENGFPGLGSDKFGRDGEPLVIDIPVGTVLKDFETEEVLKDFTRPGEKWLACRGGRGGKGNAHFVSSTHQAPKFAQPGEEGESLELTLELKLLADVGLIGFPNAGKSRLISSVSAARPKVADYAFTTLVPNLGVVSMDDSRRFVVADIPGLIEGAHEGQGLGHRFLKHIERTRLFVHVLDGADLLGSFGGEEEAIEAAADELAGRYRTIRRELELFDNDLLRHPEVVVINKCDLFADQEHLMDELQRRIGQKIGAKRAPMWISAATQIGLHQLLEAVWSELEAARATPGMKRVLLPDDEALVLNKHRVEG